MTTEETPASNPAPGPATVKDYLRRGWEAYVHGEHPEAETNLRQVLSMEPQNIEAYYALGLAYKLQRKDDAAAEAFKQVIQLVEAGGMQDDRNRATMLRHLSKWHIQSISKGQNMEPNP